MWYREVLVRTDVPEERIASIIRVEEIRELETLAVTRKFASDFPTSLIISTLMMEAIRYLETSALTRAIRHHILEDGVLRNDRRENLKSYK
jgi:hypothetical protein